MLDNVPVIKPERVDNKTGDDDAMVSDPFYTPVLFCYAPAIYNGGGGGHIASPLTVRPYIRTSRTSCPVRTKNGFWAISLEYIGVLDSYFIHR